MKVCSLVVLLTVSGCAHLKVSYGESSTFQVVQPSTDNERWYLTSSLGGDGLWFVDTGYPITTCDQHLVDSLQLKTRGRQRYHGSTGTGVATYATLPDLQIGSHQVSDLKCMVRDLDASSSISSPPEVPVVGVLGMDLLRHFRFSFDAQERVLSLEEPSEPVDLPTATNRAALKKRLQMKISIQDKPVRVLVDTGSTDTQIPGKRLGLQPSKIHVDATLRGSGGLGWRVTDLIHYQETVRIDPYAYWTVELTESLSPPALLGLDILNHANQTWDPSSARSLIVWAERGRSHPWNETLPAAVQPSSSSPSSRTIEASSAGGNE
jgi:predicted aspartyl protease